MALTTKRRKKLQAKLDKMHSYRTYHDDDVEVHNGGRCGYGLFAARQFLPGELVIEIGGQLLRSEDCSESQYLMELDDQWCLEPAIPGAFLNHSCNPNSELVQLTKRTLGIVAICNIDPGAEIRFDYRWPANEWTPRCQCGAPNCRGWIVDEDEVPKMKKIAKRLARKKAGH